MTIRFILEVFLKNEEDLLFKSDFYVLKPPFD